MSAAQLLPDLTRIACCAVRVRSKAELNVASLLRQKDFQVLVPTFTQVRRYSDRVSKVTSALFSGYIFVYMNTEDTIRVLSTDGVSYVVRNGDAAGSLTPQEIRAIEALCNSSEAREPCTYLRVGQRVRVTSGPFAGVEGILAKVRDATRVVIAVDALCSSVSVEIEPERIQLLEEDDTIAPGARENAYADTQG